MQRFISDNDAADTLRFTRVGPDATSIYDLRSAPSPRYVGRSAARRSLIWAMRKDIAGLRDLIVAGWDVGPELAHEERRLAALEAAVRRVA
jgi:hypothetical protein